MIAGAMVGALSAGALGLAPPDVLRYTPLLTAIFAILLGLYIGQWWMGLGTLERLGGALWKRIEPFTRKILPVNHLGKAVLFGLIWGWLPCGLVYTGLAWALASGNPWRGAGLMAAFGIGTLPALLLIGTASPRIVHLARRSWLRRAVAVILILFGIYTFVSLYRHAASGAHGHSHSAPVFRDG
jgi:sulfite exporter TauE/SafE